MATRNRDFRESPWQTADRLRYHKPSPEMLSWLLEEGSLTKRIKAACGNRGFRVEVVAQGWKTPQRSERHVLDMKRSTWALIREVRLMCGDTPWIFARTVIPQSTLQSSRKRLARLGTKPLGEMLFSDPSMSRGEVYVARITAQQPLFAKSVIKLDHKPDFIWGRRSVFKLDGAPLLVNEVFLPGI